MASRSQSLKWFAFASAVLLVSVASIFAVHTDGLFELGDGNGSPGSGDILASMSQEGCDWDEIFAADGSLKPGALAACGGVDAAFVADQVGTDDTVFKNNSSKNNDPVATWSWTTGKAPGKDDLSNVYAFATLRPGELPEDSELILFAGLERISASGDSHIDFEFNQNPVGLDKEPPCGDDGSEGPGDGSPCEFTGEKTEGDLLVVMDFQKGGDLGNVEIRRWNGLEYVLIDAVGGEGCNASDTVCAFNNGFPIEGGDWPSYDSKGQVIDSLERNAFTEVGVNVTALFGQTPCFFTVQAKSRSSSSFTSTLKDFAQTSFDICTFEIDKSGSPENPDPSRSKRTDEYIFRYRIENTGAATLYLVSVIDSFLGDITDEARAAGVPAAEFADSSVEGGCDPLYPGTFCEFDVGAAIPEESDDPFESSVTGTYSNDPNFIPTFSETSAMTTTMASATDAPENTIEVTDSDTLDLNLFQPSVDVTKTGDTLSTVGNAVSYLIEVTNTSSEDSPPLVNAEIIDTLLGDLLDPANPYVTGSTCGDQLDVGATCTIEATRTVEEGDPDPLPNTVSVLYNPAGVEPGFTFPNEIRDSDSHEVDLVYPDADLTITVVPSAAYEGDLIEYTYYIENTGDVALIRVSAEDTLFGDISEHFPERVEPGESFTIVLTRPIGPDDPDPLVNVVTVIYRVEGLSNEISRTASASVDILVPCALSPGFWKGGEGVPKWDNLLEDYIAQNAGFDTNTVFPWLDPSLAGSTYLDVLNLPAGGDITRQLSFKYIAARLNEATFGVPAGTAILLDRIDLYFMANPVGSDPQGAAYDEGAGLFNQINAYFLEVGEENCPPPDQF